MFDYNSLSLDWEVKLYEFLQSIGISNPSGTGWLSVVFAFWVAWGVAWYFMPPLRSFALQVGWADQPNARRLNKEPLPNVGGLAIYTGVVVAMIVATLFQPIGVKAVLADSLTIVLGGSILLLVGFIDDQFGLPPLFRLLAQIICALLLVAHGNRIEVIFGTPIDPLLSISLTVLWVVGITNAINLIDGMDGLAGGVSFITAMSLLVVSAQFPTRAAGTLLLAALAGGALGFLRHNFHPSRIILGDGGAYFLGYVLAATSILGHLKVSTVFALVPPTLFLLLPVLDTTQVFVRRLLAGKNPLTTPGKDHLHHRLLAIGFCQRSAAFTLWTVTLIFNCLAMKLQGMSTLVVSLTLSSIVLLICFTVWQRIRAMSKRRFRKRRSEVSPELHR